MIKIDKKHTPFVILSGYSDKLNYVANLESHEHLLRDIKNQGLTHKVVQGCYKGKKEPSVYIHIESDKDYKFIKNKALEFDQESILVVKSNRLAALRYIKNNMPLEVLGTFQQTTKQDALEQDAYTYDTMNDTYWVCK